MHGIKTFLIWSDQIRLDYFLQWLLLDPPVFLFLAVLISLITPHRFPRGTSPANHIPVRINFLSEYLQLDFRRRLGLGDLGRFE